MRPGEDCGICLLKWVYGRASLGFKKDLRFKLIRDLSKVLGQEFYPTTNIGKLCNKLLYAVSTFVTNSTKHYKDLKSQANKAAANILPLARKFINNGNSAEEKLKRACYLASVSNIAPLGRPVKGFSFEEVKNVIEGNGPVPTIIGDLYRAFRSATHVLYVADNAGEIGFDLLLIEKIKTMGSKITLIVKNGLFEDATMKDAEFFSLNKVIDDVLVVNGVFVPDKSDTLVNKAFIDSDLVIAKGTGNYEALADENISKRVIYMLKVKCDLIASSVGVGKGEFIVKVE